MNLSAFVFAATLGFSSMVFESHLNSESAIL